MSFGLSAAAVGLIGAGVGAGVGIYGANKAAGATKDAAQQAADTQGAQYAQTRADQAPYREAGYTSLGQLVKGTADGGEFNRNFSMADYQADPGYAFRLQQGEQGINRAAIAGGSRYSGATLKQLAGYNSDLASQEYGNAYARFNNDASTRFNRLASVAGLGTTALGATGAAGATAANGTSAALMAGGAATASGYTGTANAINGAIGSIANTYNQNQYLKQMTASSYRPTTAYYQEPNSTIGYQ